MSKVKHREQKQLVEPLDLEELTQTRTWRTVDAEAATIVLARPLGVQPMMHQAMLSKSRRAPSTTVAMTSTLMEPTDYVRALKQSLITSKA